MRCINFGRGAHTDRLILLNVEQSNNGDIKAIRVKTAAHEGIYDDLWL